MVHLLFALLSLVGTWQSTFHTPESGDVRRVMNITRSGNTYRVAIHSIDETDVPITTKSLVVNGNTATFRFDMNNAPWVNYHRVWRAQISADAKTLSGPWLGPGLSPIPTSYHRIARATWPMALAKTSMVPVDKGVRDEVLDWGGTGRPVVLLAGLDDTGHSFVKIVPALTRKYHVYSITRRGFGNSDKPPATKRNYSPTRLGEDVFAIVSALKLSKPVVIGHSIAGEELSYLGTRHAKAIAGLVYLDAGYWEAFDGGLPNPNLTMTPAPGDPPLPPIDKAIITSSESFTAPIPVPILAIFADPNPGETRADQALSTQQIDAFEKGLPNAKVIRIPNAGHYVHISNTSEVLRDIDAFVAGLPSARLDKK